MATKPPTRNCYLGGSWNWANSPSCMEVCFGMFSGFLHLHLHISAGKSNRTNKTLVAAMWVKHNATCTIHDWEWNSLEPPMKMVMAGGANDIVWPTLHQWPTWFISLCLSPHKNQPAIGIYPPWRAGKLLRVEDNFVQLSFRRVPGARRQAVFILWSEMGFLSQPLMDITWYNWFINTKLKIGNNTICSSKNITGWCLNHLKKQLLRWTSAFWLDNSSSLFTVNSELYNSEQACAPQVWGGLSTPKINEFDHQT